MRKNNENKKNSKKSQISIQFNWMLVLIVGGIILVFFIGVVQKQSEVSEESISGTIQTDLQAILNSAYVSTATSSIIEIPNREIAFSCEGFKIGNQFAAKFPYAFAPDLIKSDRNTISVFAYDWSVPYRVTNFLYVTSPDVRYIIDDDGSTDLDDKLFEILPPKYIEKDGQSNLFMNKQQTTSPYSDTNNYKVKVIYFNTGSFSPGSVFGKTKEKDISALSINPDISCVGNEEEILDCFGDVVFFNYDGSSWASTTTDYIGKASLFAAIFSENLEIYECGMNNAFGRLKNITKIYESRTTDLKDFYASSHDCYGLYEDDILPLLTGISSAASSKNYQNLYTSADLLETNNDVILANSCYTVYWNIKWRKNHKYKWWRQ